jgi:hypothetical protein
LGIALNQIFVHDVVGQHNRKDDQDGDRPNVNQNLDTGEKGRFQKDVEACHADEGEIQEKGAVEKITPEDDG